MWTRDEEEDLVESVLDAVARHRPPLSGGEADVYRLSAQLRKTGFQGAADFLDSAARQFYSDAAVEPRPFPKVVSDGLVNEVPHPRSRCSCVKQTLSFASTSERVVKLIRDSAKSKCPRGNDGRTAPNEDVTTVMS